MVMACGWEGNCRCGVTRAMRHNSGLSPVSSRHFSGEAFVANSYSTCLDSGRTGVQILVRQSVWSKYVMGLISWADMERCSLFVLKVPLNTN